MQFYSYIAGIPPLSHGLTVKLSMFSNIAAYLAKKLHVTVCGHLYVPNLNLIQGHLYVPILNLINYLLRLAPRGCYIFVIVGVRVCAGDLFL